MAARSRVVIVGAGFAGLWAARRLERAPADVLVIDRNNYHTFLPLLYQVAASELGPTSIAYPVRSILRRGANADFRMAEVEDVDLERRAVHAAGERIAYDYLLLAMGSAAYFFGVEGAERHCFPLKTMDEAIPLRHHILTCLEAAAHETDANRRQAQLTFTCVGGGPTGVEFAGALAELVYGPLLRDYRAVSNDEVRIILLEAGDRLLPGMPEKLSRYARERLERRRVRVGLDARVRRVSATELELEDGETVATETVVWSAGVTGAPGPAEWGLPMGPGGRVGVNPFLQVSGHPEVFVAGDLAYVEQRGEVLPGVAPVAIQEGNSVADNIVRTLEGRPLRPFDFKDPGILAVIGRYSAAAHMWGRSFTGIIAWMIWAGVHIVELIGFRNRLLVLVNWAWNYLSFERAARLILPYRGEGRSPAPGA